MKDDDIIAALKYRSLERKELARSLQCADGSDWSEHEFSKRLRILANAGRIRFAMGRWTLINRW
jgi:hypothetical protein